MHTKLLQHFNRIYSIKNEKENRLSDFLYSFFLDMSSGSQYPIPIIICGWEEGTDELVTKSVTNVYCVPNENNTWKLIFGSYCFNNKNVATNHSIPIVLNPYITELEISIINDNGEHIVHPVDSIRFSNGMIEIIYDCNLHENSIIDPKVFTEKMREAVNMERETEAHERADQLMAELLIQLGYKEAVDMFFHLNRYY